MKMYNPKTRQADLSARERLSKYRRHKRWVRAVSVLAAVMVFVTTYSMILPTLTATRTDLSTADLPKTHTLQSGDILTLSDAIYAKYVLPVDEPETDVDDVDADSVDVNDNAIANDIVNVNASAPHVAIVVNPAADPQDDALLAAAIRDEEGAAKLVDLSMDSQEIACVDRVYVEQHVEDFPAFSAAIMDTMDAVESAALLEEEQTAILRGAVEHTLGVLSGEIEEDSEEATVLDTLEEAIDEAASEETAASMEDETDVTGDAAADAAEATQEEAEAALDEEVAETEAADSASTDEDAAVSDAVEEAASDAEAASDEAAAESADKPADSEAAETIDGSAADDAAASAEGEEASATTDAATGSEQDPAGAADGRREAEALTPSEEDADKTGEATELTDAERLQLEKDAKSAALPITLSRVVDGVTVTAQFARDVLPSGAQLQVHAVDGAAYEELVADATGKNDRVVKPLDIGFVAGGQEVEPDGDVQISFQADFLDEQANPEVIHVTDEGSAEILESTLEDGQLTLTTDSFSVYVIAYTVDFHYEVNGKMYDFSLPGGGFVSFENLIEVLGISKQDVQGDFSGEVDELSSEVSSAPLTLADVEISEDTRKFVADVESITFSTPSLLSVSKVEKNTTVGAIKDSLGLECEYSAELTEEQIEEINSSTVEAGDWALISVHPFVSTEYLTVTMKNGDQFEIRVTDAQIKKTVISASGETYEITVTYGEDAQIPDGAELKVREITKEDDQYEQLTAEAEAAYAEKNQKLPDHLVTFDIAIMDGKEEVEPAEGSFVAVDIRLKNELAEKMTSPVAAGEEDSKDTGVESGVESVEDAPSENQEPQTSDGNTSDEFIMEGVGIWLNDQKLEVVSEEESDPGIVDVDVIHHIAGKEASAVDHVDCAFEEGELDLRFTTDAFSSYSIGGKAGDSTQVNLGSLANLKVGDSVYFVNSAHYAIRNVSVPGAAVLSSRGDDNHRVLEIYQPCTFEIYNIYNQYDRQFVTVTDRTHTPYSDQIETVDNNDIGLTLSLFDYDLDNQLNEWWNRTYDGNFTGSVANYYTSHGINKDHDLKFWAGGPTYTSDGHAEYNAWLGDVLGTTIVDKNNMAQVGDELYPKLTNGKSLDYLFTKSTDESADRRYYAANHLFSEEDGYYVYNSGMTSDGGTGHYAYFNKDTGNFEVYDKTYYYTKDGKKFPIGFFPFTQLDEDAVKNGNLSSNQYPNHHFGMSMSVDFDIPEDKLDPNDNHISFEFSGDDDMWVFVDGKLVLDISGIHQPIGGKVDFTTGQVTYQDKNGNTITKNAYSPDLNNLKGNRGTAVNSYGTHTLQIFYIERGGGDSNCMIKFNTIPYKKIKFNKIDANNKRIPGAVFKLFKDENCTQAVMIPRTKTEGGQKVNYYEEAVSTSTADGYVIFDKIPVGTYYMKETSAPDHYDSDGKVYTAVVTASEVSTDNYATIYWKDQSHPIGEGIVNYEKFPIEVTKKWVKAGMTGEAVWPKDTTISYKVIRHAYLEVTGSDDTEIPGTEEVVFTAEGDSLLTETHKSHVVPDLSKVGKWKSPLVVTQEMEALGIIANTEYPVKYKYTVVENPEGSTYTGTGALLPIEATTTATDVDITVSGGTTEKGDKVLLTNEITELEVLKTWKDGDDKHENDSVTVQLYRVVKKSDTPVIPDPPADDSKITILVDNKWVYADETSAKEKDIPKSGTIKALISDGETTWTLDLKPDNNWTASQSDLPKKDKDGKNITYTVTYDQQGSSFLGATNVKSVEVTQPSSVTGSNGKVTFKATVEETQPPATTMTVPFTGSWVNNKGETANPADNAKIIATVKNADGTVAATVILDKSNNWKDSRELPCSNGYDDFKYTVEYSATGDYVTGVGGRPSFSGANSSVNAVGLVIEPEISDGKMALQVVANGIVATGNDQWQIQINQTVHRVNSDGSDNWDKNQYNFPDGILKGSTTSSTISNMNVKDSENITIRYKMHVQAEHITKGTISVIGPNGNIIDTKNFTDGWNGDLVFDAKPGTFTVRIDGENATTATTKSTNAMRRNAAPLKAANDSTKTFTDDINHSGLQLPADADPVGEPVTLKKDDDSAKNWKHLWENLPVSDSEGNTYYYYVKEVSATTAGNVAELGAVYEYGYADTGNTRIHKVTIENTPTLVKTDIHLKKQNDDEELLSDVPFTLWEKGGAGTSGGEYAEVTGYIDVKTNKGIIVFAELKPGDYKITEGTPLPGYLGLSEEIVFTIGSDGKISGFTNTNNVTFDQETFTFTVINNKAFALPSTGGPGTRLFTILGSILILGAGVLLLRRRRLI